MAVQPAPEVPPPSPAHPNGEAPAPTSIWLRIAFGVVLAVIVFSVVQPMLWRAIFHQTPPQGSEDLSSLIAIVITVVSIGVASIGVIALRQIDARTEQANAATRSANEAAANAEGSAQKAKVAADLVPPQVATLNNALRLSEARTNIPLGYAQWSLFASKWREKNFSNDVFDDPDASGFLTEAIGLTQDALDGLSAIAPEPSFEVQLGRAKRMAANNLAYYLAARNREPDRAQALRILEAHILPAEKTPGEGEHFQETVAWVYLRRGPHDEHWPEGIRRYGGLPDAFKARQNEKYQKIFATPGPWDPTE